MTDIALTNGERYTFARQGTVTVITDSTDSAEATKVINNNLTISGSTSRKILIDTSTSTNDAFVHFKSSGTTFTAGVDGDENSFAIGTNTSLTGPGSTATALRIPDVTSPKVHFDWGIVVTGSASVNGTLAVTGSIKVPNSSDINASIVNNNFVFYNTSDSNLTVDAAVTQSLAWVSNFTADRALFITNLIKGRKFEAYILNAGVTTTRNIVISGSVNTTGGKALPLAQSGAVGWTNNKNLVPEYGAAYIHVQNFATSTDTIYGSIT
jgi:hypothetical protein